MEIVLFWTVFAILIGVFAAGRDRNGVGWFALAMLVSPLIALLMLIVAGEGNVTRCPFCAERVKMRAKICPHCRGDLGPPSDIVIEGQERPKSRWRSGLR
ncbi:MAG TPA: hypothetical protein VIH40_11765 [Xanthobacteraceae bacterium]